MATQARTFFLRSSGNRPGQRYCVFHPAEGGKAKALALYLHPFAEEMNKARRMAALQARMLARGGCSVLQIDLLGCGDSSGDFADATWEDWVQDGVQACSWLREQCDAPIWLWGLRAGCLLTVDLATVLADISFNFLMWAPITDGKAQLRQFLRLKSASNVVAGADDGGTKALRERLIGGEPVEVGGYAISPELALGLERATLSPPKASPLTEHKRLAWLDLSTREDASLSLSSTKSIASWVNAGYATHSRIIQGPAFWHTSEIEEAARFLPATIEAVLGPPANFQ